MKKKKDDRDWLVSTKTFELFSRLSYLVNVLYYTTSIILSVTQNRRLGFIFIATSLIE